jgi:hypothetical protein
MTGTNKIRGVFGNPKRWRNAAQAMNRAAIKRRYLMRKRLKNLDTWDEWRARNGIESTASS